MGVSKRIPAKKREYITASSRALDSGSSRRVGTTRLRVRVTIAVARSGGLREGSGLREHIDGRLLGLLTHETLIAHLAEMHRTNDTVVDSVAAAATTMA